MMDLLKRITTLRVAPNSPDTDQMVELICQELPFQIHEYAAGLEHNGWVVPEQWFVKTAVIKKNGKQVYDGKKEPLGVIGYSESFRGDVDLEELKRHIFSNPDPMLDYALVYHCANYYNPECLEWGFSMPRREVERLAPGSYSVDLQVQKNGGTMKVADYFLPGQSERTVVFNAHNCHAGQANDDMSGVVVGVELMKRLALWPSRRLGYRLVIAPEHLGTVFYLSDRPVVQKKSFACGVFLEMLGNENGFAYQESFCGNHFIDRAVRHVLRHYHAADVRRRKVGMWDCKHEPERSEDQRFGYFVAPFRKIVGNDETVWEAAGIEVPFGSLSRWPYAEYHSNKDNCNIISEARLESSVVCVLRAVEILENNCVMHRLFEGLVRLSNPKFGLYMNPLDPSIRPTVSIDAVKWNYLMDCLPRYFDGRTTLLDVAEKHDLPFSDLLAYVKRFEQKGLVRLEPASLL